MLNLDILLRNYQDEEGDTLKHPVWIEEMIKEFESLNSRILENGGCLIEENSPTHQRIKNILKEEE
jgi:hypothetical protein